MTWESVTDEARGGLGARSWSAAALAASRTRWRSPPTGPASLGSIRMSLTVCSKL
jgi:hypothetical protein